MGTLNEKIYKNLWGYVFGKKMIPELYITIHLLAFGM